MLSSLNQAFENTRGKISAIKQSIDLHRRLSGRRQVALGSFTLSSKMATGRMISSQILTSVLPFGILHADIHALVVEVLGPQVGVARRRRHLEVAIPGRPKGSAKGATSQVVDQHVAQCHWKTRLEHRWQMLE